jgi:hypothetical protein
MAYNPTSARAGAGMKAFTASDSVSSCRVVFLLAVPILSRSMRNTNWNGTSAFGSSLDLIRPEDGERPLTAKSFKH